jgi:prophage DNA circulation protein
MNIDELRPASYRNAFFFICVADTTGGRKIARQSPVDSDKQLLEDQGLINRAFSITGAIAARRDNNGAIITPYLQVRRDLLAALEKGGPGTLEHPFFGTLENMVAVNWSINEDVKRLGDASLNITFEVSNTDGLPQQSTSVISKVKTDTDSVMTNVQSALEEFEVEHANNFEKAVEKLTALTDKFRDVTLPPAAAIDKLNDYSNKLDKFADFVISAVNDPTGLALDVVDLLVDIDTLYAVAESALGTYEKLFGFGDDDVEFTVATAESQERKTNQDIVNTAVQASALAYAYYNASKIDYDTVSSIQETNARLEAQYQKLFAADNVDPDTMDTLTELRITTQSYFDAEKLTARRIITVQTPPTSTQLLAFQYYGESDLGETIAELNEFDDGVYNQGSIEIFTS